MFQRLWGLLVECCQELDSVNWQWQSADATMTKARFGGIMSAPIPRIAENQAQNAAC